MIYYKSEALENDAKKQRIFDLQNYGYKKLFKKI